MKQNLEYLILMYMKMRKSYVGIGTVQL